MQKEVYNISSCSPGGKAYRPYWEYPGSRATLLIIIIPIIFIAGRPLSSLHSEFSQIV